MWYVTVYNFQFIKKSIFDINQFILLSIIHIFALIILQYAVKTSDIRKSKLQEFLLDWNGRKRNYQSFSLKEKKKSRNFKVNNNHKI